MSGSKLRFILGGACFGLIIGAIYGAMLYDMYGKSDETEAELIEAQPVTQPVTKSVEASSAETNHYDESEAWEPVRKASAVTQRKARETRREAESVSE